MRKIIHIDMDAFYAPPLAEPELFVGETVPPRRAACKALRRRATPRHRRPLPSRVRGADRQRRQMSCRSPRAGASPGCRKPPRGTLSAAWRCGRTRPSAAADGGSCGNFGVSILNSACAPKALGCRIWPSGGGLTFPGLPSSAPPQRVADPDTPPLTLQAAGASARFPALLRFALAGSTRRIADLAQRPIRFAKD